MAAGQMDDRDRPAIGRRSAAEGFEVFPSRWVVERTIAWLNRDRRLAKDFEQTIASATAGSSQRQCRRSFDAPQGPVTIRL